MKAQTNKVAPAVYGPDDKPPAGVMLGLVLQYVATACSSLLLPILITTQAHVDAKVAVGIVSIAMILCAISVLLQCLKGRWLGVGFFVAATPAPVFLAPSIMAIKLGGMGLMAGMTIFSGAVLGVLSAIVKHLERFFPPELGALLISLIGIELGALGLNSWSSLPIDTAHGAWQLGIGVVSLLVILVVHVWCKGAVKLLGLLIGLVFGYCAMLLAGQFDVDHLHTIAKSAWLALPYWRPFHYKFSTELVVPFVISAIICSVKITGSLTAIQQAQQSRWKGANMQQIGRSGYADAAINGLAGVFGCIAYNVDPAIAAITASTKSFSRYIAYPYAALFCVMALCPKLAYVCIYMPPSVLAAIMVFLGATLLFSGFAALGPLLTTMQRRLVVGLSFMLGLNYEISPMFYAHLPASMQVVTGSSITLALLFAVVLNFVFMLRLETPDHMKSELEMRVKS